MLLKRFIRYFIRTQSDTPDNTVIVFQVDGQNYDVLSLEFDVNGNAWTVKLKQETVEGA